MSKPSYEEKFKSFIEMCAQAKTDGVDAIIIHHPETLGDTYAEVIESLNRLSLAELHLAIVPPSQRGKPDIARKK